MACAIVWAEFPQNLFLNVECKHLLNLWLKIVVHYLGKGFFSRHLRISLGWFSSRRIRMLIWFDRGWLQTTLLAAFVRLKYLSKEQAALMLDVHSSIVVVQTIVLEVFCCLSGH